MAVVAPRQAHPNMGLQPQRVSLAGGRSAPYMMKYLPTAIATAFSKAPLHEGDGTMLTCTSLSQWLSPEAGRHQGLRVARPINPAQWQPLADHLTLTSPEEKIQESLHVEEIDLDSLSVNEADVHRQVQAAASSAASSLPPDLADIVSKDAQGLVEALRKLVPKAKKITMKLELFGKSTCARWHQDNYVCRGIVSYNCSGTAYTADSNVDFNELFYCGNNECIIRDKARIRSVDVGDLVLIKGTKFPGQAQGIVHKSADVRYHANGLVQSRLILKVDVTHMDEGDGENSSKVTGRSAVAPEDLRVIDRSELAANNTAARNWIAIDGMVYDVTNFKHPGGLHRIKTHAGTDATEAFYTVRHSSRAQKYMADMLIGRLADAGVQ